MSRFFGTAGSSSVASSSATVLGLFFKLAGVRTGGAAGGGFEGETGDFCILNELLVGVSALAHAGFFLTAGSTGDGSFPLLELLVGDSVSFHFGFFFFI